MHWKYTTDLIPISCKNFPFSYFIASAFTKCHFWNHCQLVLCRCRCPSFSFIQSLIWHFRYYKCLWQILWDFCLSNIYSPITWSEHLGKSCVLWFVPVCVCDYEIWNWTLDLQTGKHSHNKTICLADCSPDRPVSHHFKPMHFWNKQQQLNHCICWSSYDPRHQWDKTTQHSSDKLKQHKTEPETQKASKITQSWTKQLGLKLPTDLKNPFINIVTNNMHCSIHLWPWTGSDGYICSNSQ